MHSEQVDEADGRLTKEIDALLESPPFRFDWLDVTSANRGRPAKTSGLLVSKLGSPFMRIRFDRRAAILAAVPLHGEMLGRLASVRFNGEARAQQGSPRSVVELLRRLAEDPTLTEIDAELTVIGTALHFGCSPTNDQLRREARRVSSRFPPGTLQQTLLSGLLGDAALAAILCQALRAKHKPTGSSVGTILTDARYSALASALERHRAHSVWPLVSCSAATGCDPVAITTASTGSAKAFGVLKRLPLDAVALIEARATPEWLSVGGRRHLFFRHLIAMLLCARGALERCDTGRIREFVAWLTKIAARLVNLDSLEQEGFACISFACLPEFADIGDHVWARLEGAETGPRMKLLRQLLQRTRDLVVSGEADFSSIPDSFGAISWWIAYDTNLKNDSLRHAGFCRLKERAREWQAALEARKLGPWPCALARPMIIRRHDAQFRFTPLLDDEALEATAWRFGNCLRSDQTRAGYRRRVLRGTSRFFSIEREAQGGNWKGCLLLLIHHAGTDGWQVQEQEGANRRGASPLESAAIEQFLTHYRKAHSTAYPSLIPPAFGSDGSRR